MADQSVAQPGAQDQNINAEVPEIDSGSVSSEEPVDRKTLEAEIVATITSAPVESTLKYWDNHFSISSWETSRPPSSIHFATGSGFKALKQEIGQRVRLLVTAACDIRVQAMHEQVTRIAKSGDDEEMVEWVLEEAQALKDEVDEEDAVEIERMFGV